MLSPCLRTVSRLNVRIQDHATTNMLYVKPDDPLAGRVVSLWKCTEAGDKVSRIPGCAPLLVAVPRTFDLCVRCIMFATVVMKARRGQ